MSDKAPIDRIDLQAGRYDMVGHLRDEDTKNIIERIEMLIEKE